MKNIRSEDASSIDDAPTRERVATAILEGGPATAAELASALALTPAAVRRHLDQLVLDGIVAPRDKQVVGRRGRGRPAKVFAITDAGRDHFEHGYDELAVEALRFLQASGGDEAVMAFARGRLSDLEERYAPIVSAAEPAERLQVLAEALTSDGYAASVGSVPNGAQMCQHHCPVAHVAVEFPHLCEAETEMFATLLGTHVQRLATIAHGDGVCTTNLPNIDRDPSTTAERLPS